MTDQLLYQIGLTMINGVGNIMGRQLLQAFGSAEAVFAEKRAALERIPGIGSVIAANIKDPDVLRRAEKELDFVEKHRIDCYFMTEAGYPKRLRECEDAPVMLYYKGNADLNAPRIISIVGTRNATDYGKSLTEKLIGELAALIPDLLVISGLAYGIDILAHRAALKHRLPTVAVLAHGLDRIYPFVHKGTAAEMLAAGGLLTDFPSQTTPDKVNFVKRNRIVAGLPDATIIIESAEKGGSLITADLAFSYGREVFAFPGRVTDTCSQGCNRIIRQNKAELITCAADLISSIGWDVERKTLFSPPPMPSLFAGKENDDHHRVITLLREKNELHINQLAVEMDMPVHRLSTLLFELEMNNAVKAMPGSMYKLL
ncbi:MAG: DNA-processing protein DprA [Tannerellaceae bacterium]|jgi:DNA processing protein|nr:DNA-processing protein DprA [Tannerellaceae bacterium]